VLAEAEALDAEDARSGAWRALADAEILLADKDREGALVRAREALEAAQEHFRPRDVAALVWWMARVFGEDEAGGREEAQRAHKLLEGLRWGQALAATELVAGR
jgi:hypothetical protein